MGLASGYRGTVRVRRAVFFGCWYILWPCVLVMISVLGGPRKRLPVTTSRYALGLYTPVGPLNVVTSLIEQDCPAVQLYLVPRGGWTRS